MFCGCDLHSKHYLFWIIVFLSLNYIFWLIMLSFLASLQVVFSRMSVLVVYIFCIAECLSFPLCTILGLGIKFLNPFIFFSKLIRLCSTCFSIGAILKSEVSHILISFFRCTSNFTINNLQEKCSPEIQNSSEICFYREWLSGII